MLEDWQQMAVVVSPPVCSDALTSLTGPPSSTGPNPSLDILGLLQLRQETHELREGKRPLKGKTRTLKTKQKKDLKKKKNIFFIQPMNSALCHLIFCLDVDLICSKRDYENHWVCITVQFSNMNIFSGEQKKNASVLKFMINSFSCIPRSLTHQLWRYRDWESWRRRQKFNCSYREIKHSPGFSK